MVSKRLMKDSRFVEKKFILEAIVQVARSIGTKFLDTNIIFISLRGLSVAFNNTDLKPLNNNFQRIKLHFFGEIIGTYKEF